MADRDVFLIEVARRGRDSVPAPPDYATMRSDITLVKNRANITKLTDVPDVTGTPSSGDTIVYNAGTSRWNPGSVSGAINRVGNADDPGSSEYDVNYISVRQGIQMVSSAPGVVFLQSVYGGTGSSHAVSRSDHSHTGVIRARIPIAKKGYMSSGSRRLGTGSITLVNGIPYDVKTTLNVQMRGADAGACYFSLTTSIGGNAHTSPTGSNGPWTVQGVPVMPQWTQWHGFAGTGIAMTVYANCTYVDGGGFYSDFGWIDVEAFPRR